MSNIDVPTEDGCSFCDYLANRRPFTILRRDDLTAVLVTREQRGVGHLLVIPVRHVATLLDASTVERHAIIDALHWAATAINATFERPGIAVWQNNGVEAHQAIPHLHFHIAGTLEGGGTDFGDVPELSLDETDEIAAAIQDAVGPS